MSTSENPFENLANAFEGTTTQQTQPLASDPNTPVMFTMVEAGFQNFKHIFNNAISKLTGCLNALATPNGTNPPPPVTTVLASAPASKPRLSSDPKGTPKFKEPNMFNGKATQKCIHNSAAFMQAFEEHFGDSNTINTAFSKLEDLYQANSVVNCYSQYVKWIIHLNLTEASKIHYFYRNSNPDLKDTIANQIDAPKKSLKAYSTWVTTMASAKSEMYNMYDGCNAMTELTEWDSDEDKDEQHRSKKHRGDTPQTPLELPEEVAFVLAQEEVIGSDTGKKIKHGVRIISEENAGVTNVPPISFIIIGKREPRSSDIVKVFDQKSGNSFWSSLCFKFLTNFWKSYTINPICLAVDVLELKNSMDGLNWWNVRSVRIKWTFGTAIDNTLATLRRLNGVGEEDREVEYDIRVVSIQ
ncbi:hypothetical protein GGU10DRAFT_399830 [Lentinula aff. detonsa]|uniref:Uncharacterized protein n=1 Tax=Lentinula aff. detonsa TaxID=2804958 RepID=A0AA38K9U7_9AGAR|nr:hypothetical protein GGU10DRAFT_399830 [Lentinula aff. detonsa]